MNESTLAQKLREAFDETFTRPAVSWNDAVEDLLAIRVGKSQLALRRSEIAAIMRCPPLTPLPSRNPSFRGLGSVRGSLVAAYSIGSLLGLEDRSPSNGWIVLCGAERSAALLFDELVGYFRLPANEIHRADSPEQEIGAHEVVRVSGTLRPVLDVARLMFNLRRGGRPAQRGTSQ